MRRIKGFITGYGGANSYMSIRANELGLHATSAACEEKYQLWLSAKRPVNDCVNCRMEVKS